MKKLSLEAEQLLKLYDKKSESNSYEIIGLYPGEYLENAQKDITSLKIIEDFAYIVSTVSLQHWKQCNALIMNQDQKKHFLEWLHDAKKENASPIILASLYALHAVDMESIEKIYSIEKNIRFMTESEISLRTLVNEKNVIDVLEIIPDKVNLYEKHLKAFVNNADDAYEYVDDLKRLACLSNSGKLRCNSIKILQHIKKLVTDNVDIGHKSYEPLCEVYGKRGVYYLNIVLADTTPRKFDKIIVKYFMEIIKTEDVMKEDLDLLSRYYHISFDVKIKEISYLDELLEEYFTTLLCTKEWTGIYNHEVWFFFWRENKEKIEKASSYFDYFNVENIVRWQALDLRSKSILVSNRLLEFNGSKEEIETLSKIENLFSTEENNGREIILSSMEECSNYGVIYLMVQLGYWPMPSDENVKSSRWITEGYFCKKQFLAMWLLRWSQRTKILPLWILKSSGGAAFVKTIEDMKWLQDIGQEERFEMFEMMLDVYFTKFPGVIKDLLNSLYKKYEAIDLRSFMEDTRLKQYTQYLIEQGILPKENHILKYTMTSDQYAAYTAKAKLEAEKREELDNLKKFQRKLNGVLTEFIDRGCKFTGYQYFISENDFLFPEFQKIASLKALENFENSKNVINYVSCMLNITEANKDVFYLKKMSKILNDYFMIGE